MKRHVQLNKAEQDAVYIIGVYNETHNVAPPTSRVRFKRGLLRGLERKGYLKSKGRWFGPAINRRWYLAEWQRVPTFKWYFRKVRYWIIDAFENVKLWLFDAGDKLINVFRIRRRNGTENIL